MEDFAQNLDGKIERVDENVQEIDGTVDKIEANINGVEFGDALTPIGTISAFIFHTGDGSEMQTPPKCKYYYSRMNVHLFDFCRKMPLIVMCKFFSTD